ncbi:MAG: carboxypeptidase regulatory-like domain-containing protein [Chitinophagaceae bacterium]|nr:carboxypeptidase regulatory-like domain-containing protein [Chitinophagaceae bacterium]
MKLLNPFAKVLSVIALYVILFAGCKKNDSLLEPIKPPIETPPTANDAIKVAATVTGTVIDENNLPVANAAVTAGTATTTTDAMGNFSFRNIVISVANGNVTVNKAGYFKGIRNFVTEEGKNNYVKIQLLKQVLTGTITAAAGGSVTTNGAVITFPANAFETTAGVAYTGNVKVYAIWIDPTAANLPLVVPGDLRGINSSNGEYLLKSYGMVGAELKDDNGNTLKIVTGKTAGISFPIPSALQSTAPATIPLWHFDESTNRWREEGTATKTGNNYVGQVNKFSFWNVDVPANFIYLNMRLLNSANSLPLANTMVKVTSLATNTYAYDFTNDSGFVAGYVPKNEYLKIEVIAGTACNTNTVVYTQNAGPYTANTYLGDISVTLPVNTVINFTGTVKGCNNMPVSNGYVSLSLANGTSTIAYTNASGVVNFSLISCGGTNTTYTYTAVDLSNGNYSNTATSTATGNTVNLGTIAACGNTINLSGVYIAGEIDGRAVVWKDGIPTFLTPVPSGNQYAYATKVLVYNNDVYVLGNDEDSTIANGSTATIKLWKNGVATNITSGLTQSFGYGLDVYNGNVYICGQENISGTLVSKIWKNGVATTLTNGIFNDIDAKNIKVVNGDVYVCGTGSLGFSEYKSIYWKNGTLNILPTTGQYNGANNLFTNNNDIYIVGYDSSNAVVWKNGLLTTLNVQPPNIYGRANSIFVQNNDIYVAGSLSPGIANGAENAVYWKNNNINLLTNYTAPNTYASLGDIFVKNNIVYTIGYFDTFVSYNVLYYQNNILVPLTGFNNTQDVYLEGIFVQ